MLLATLIAVVLTASPMTHQEWGPTGKIQPLDPIAILRSLAERGSVNAQAQLAAHLFTGIGCPKDENESLRWFKLAASGGQPYAQCVMGMLCVAGTLVPRDFLAAYVWLGKAVLGGNDDAQDMLGKARSTLSREQVEEGNRQIREYLIDHE